MTPAVAPKTVLVYQDADGREPFTSWLGGLRDHKARRAILMRLGRLEQGLYGDCAPVGDGVSELRIFLGPGYRVYFGETGGHIVILLCGGDKASQTRDIKAAKGFWQEYLTHG
ncbi:type II toxin-antitoxin system RelE/ParE family toxin [Ferrovibrio sp.]|uniref:type II toxin-antitoxin system RelE/ParE family toxin n=1 Tax=Ferrovibrio sp. TaxID=1917215 RepID=UPI0035B37D17